MHSLAINRTLVLEKMRAAKSFWGAKRHISCPLLQHKIVQQVFQWDTSQTTLLQPPWQDLVRSSVLLGTPVQLTQCAMIQERSPLTGVQVRHEQKCNIGAFSFQNVAATMLK